MRIDGTTLRGILDCMHDEADERDKRSGAIRDIVKAAKNKGFDGKALRKVFARERMNAADRAEQDGLVESYEAALGGKGRALRAIADGAAVGEAAKANGVHRATLARARHVAKQAENATPDHDPETGEISETAVSDQPGDDTRTPEPSRSAEVVANPTPLGADIENPSPVAEGGIGTGANSDDTTYREAVKAIWTTPEDDLAFPAGLDRRRVRAA